MCRLKIYLGIEICGASKVASSILIAFFFKENGIINRNKLCALESIYNEERYKLDCSNNTHELIARD